MMEHAIDVEHVNEVDYLTGDDRYKKDWMSQRRERWGILALNPRSLRGAVAIARHVGGRAVKRAAVSLAARFRRKAFSEQSGAKAEVNSKKKGTN
jgi:CelD/BcsL family acetyltransferase involved in cellulose biosynthesis